MKTNKFKIATFAIIFFFSLNAISQNTKIYQITPAINKKISEEFPSLFKIYHITKKKIKYNEYEMGTVLSKEYEERLNSLNSLKRWYENYKAPLQAKKDDLTLCIKLIDEYLKSDLKFELKKEFLIQSQELVNKYKIQIIVKRENLYKNVYEVELFIYKEETKPSKNDLKEIRDIVDRILQNIPDPEKSEKYLEYTSKQEEIKNIAQYVPGIVLSEKESEREVRMVDVNKVDADSLSGTFHVLPEINLHISQRNLGLPRINKSYIKNEIVEYKDVKQYEDTYHDIFSSRYGSIIEEINTKEQYFVGAENASYLSKVADCQKDIELLNILHELGYKEYTKEFYDQLKGNYNKSFIKTKTAEIEIKEGDNNLYYMLKENKASLSSFDNDHLKLISLMKQCITYTSSLTNFNNIYDIKRGFTPVTTINAWRTKAISANKLVGQIMDIRGKYAYIYSFSEVENSAPFQTFLDNSVKSNRALNLNY